MINMSYDTKISDPLSRKVLRESSDYIFEYSWFEHYNNKYGVYKYDYLNIFHSLNNKTIKECIKNNEKILDENLKLTVIMIK